MSLTILLVSGAGLSFFIIAFVACIIVFVTMRGSVSGATSGAAAVLANLPQNPASFTPTPTSLHFCHSSSGQIQNCTFGLFRLSGSGPAGPVVVTLSSHLAGGIYTLSYAGTNFVQPMAITGGSMQSDIYLGGGVYNPTEAGSSADSLYNTGKSTSKLLEMRADATRVYTSTQAAYWASPGVVDPAHGHIPPYTNPVSDCVVSKLLEFVGNGALDYTVVWTVPQQTVLQAMAEAYCGWVPFPASEIMQGYIDGTWSTLVNWDQQHPPHHPTAIVIASGDGTRAMALVLRQWPSLPSWALDAYPMFGAGEVNVASQWRKWNITHPMTSKALQGGNYTWKMRLFFGTLAGVKQQAQALAFPHMSNSYMRQ